MIRTRLYRIRKTGWMNEGTDEEIDLHPDIPHKLLFTEVEIEDNLFQQSFISLSK